MCGVSALGAKPADCFACRACEGRCHFDVRKAMRATAAGELIGCLARRGRVTVVRPWRDAPCHTLLLADVGLPSCP